MLDLLVDERVHRLRIEASERDEGHPQPATRLLHHDGGALVGRCVDVTAADQKLPQPLRIGIGVREDDRAVAEVEAFRDIVFLEVKNAGLSPGMDDARELR